MSVEERPAFELRRRHETIQIYANGRVEVGPGNGLLPEGSCGVFNRIPAIVRGAQREAIDKIARRATIIR